VARLLGVCSLRAFEEMRRERKRARADARQWRRRAGQYRRSLLSRRVLKSVLQARARQWPADAHEAMAAAAREERFLDASAAYRRLVEDEPARLSGLQAVAIDGLPWWIPRNERAPEGAERAARQHFPYRVILQTREWAVGGVMLDIGANIGTTSITRALLGDVRAVYAAEPEPGNYKALVQNVVAHRLRGVVLPDQVAIGAARGESPLLRSRFLGGHRVLFGPIASGADVVSVPVWPLDQWLIHVGVEPGAVTFVKVDAQGSEVEVLRGAQALLARRQAAWQIEVDPELLGRAGRSVASLVELLQTHFTHYVDIATREPGPRVEAIGRIAEALSAVGASKGKTDVLLFNAE
jgi:FkbM family methyltransferase